MTKEHQGPLSVSEAARKAKEGFERIRLTIEGEISELKNNRGYKSVFFTIKDEHAVLYCKMWRSQFEKADLDLEVGSLVRITGRFTIWAEKGDIKFEASAIAYAGEGALRARVAKLERELRAEGLFDQARKKPLPMYPERIGLVTSAKGAVVHDVLRTLRESYPLATVYFAGVPVEGKDAPLKIIEGMRAVYRQQVEVILLVIGGGSFEHLMAFNDERLVRAMSKCPTPIVTGIGHERDNFLADLVSDLRCTSPTKAAAEIGPSFDLIERYHAGYLDRMGNAIQLQFQHAHLRLEKFESRPVFCDSNQLLSDKAQHVDYLAQRLEKGIPNRLNREKDALLQLDGRLKRAIPGAVRADAQHLALLQERLVKQLPLKAKAESANLQARERGLRAKGPGIMVPYAKDLNMRAARMHDLSPLAVMSRGYSIARSADGAVLSKAESIQPGNRINVQFADGVAHCVAEDVKIAPQMGSSDPFAIDLGPSEPFAIDSESSEPSAIENR